MSEETSNRQEKLTEPPAVTVRPASAVKYMAGDLVLLFQWCLVLAPALWLSQKSTIWLFPLWLYLCVCGLALVMPRVPPGKYSMKSKQTTLWFFTYQFGRLWGNPLLKHLIFSFNSLRTFFLKCCGAKVPWNMGWAPVSHLSDPYLLEIGEDTIVGVETTISGHMIIHDQLILGRIFIGRGCLIGARSGLGPNTILEDQVILQAEVKVLPGVRVPRGTKVPLGAVLSKS
jgi:hypothetical protein